MALAAVTSTAFKQFFKIPALYDRYECPLCKLLLQKAVQTVNCGHWYCEECLLRLLETSIPCCCLCGESLNSEEDTINVYFPDKFVRRDVDALEIVCPHINSGCTWEGTVGTIQDHLPSCQLCPNKKILDAKTAVCRCMPTLCPLCKEPMLDDQFKHFELHCSLYEKECDFKDDGCTFKGNFKALKLHYANETRFHLCIGRASKKMQRSLEEKIHTLHVELNEIKSVAFKTKETVECLRENVQCLQEAVRCLQETVQCLHTPKTLKIAIDID